MEDADDVGAIVHRDVGLVVGGRLDVRVVRVVVLALDGEDGRVVLLHERRRDVVLRGQRVRGAQHDVRPARNERAHEVRGLRGDMQARGHAVPCQGLLPLEALADGGEHRHLAVGPGDAADAVRRLPEVTHVESSRNSH